MRPPLTARLRGVALLAIVGLVVVGRPVWAQAPANQTQSTTVPVVGAGTPSQAVAVTNVPSPAAPPHAVDQITWALIISYALNYLKKAGWFPFLTQDSTARLKAQFGFVAALLTAAGVHFAVSGSIWDGSGASLTVTGLSLSVVKDVAFQWATQQGFYDAIIHAQTA